MDSRHESIEQQTLNELIDLMNVYVRDHIDDVLTDEKLHQDIKKVARYVYEYTCENVDLESLLSKHNLLSIDVIPLPRIDELNLPEVTAKSTYIAAIDGIKSVVVDHYPELVTDQQFHRSVREIVDKPGSSS